MGRGRPPLPPGHDKRSRVLGSKKVVDTKRRLGAVQRRSSHAMYQRTYRQKRVLEVMSSQDSCASTVSSGDSSAASSGLSDRSLHCGASSCLNAIKHLGYEGQRKLFQRSDFIGVLGNHGMICRPLCAPEEGEVEVDVEGDDTCVGQPPTVPTCCISVMDEFLCSQQISDMSPYKKHQVRKRCTCTCWG